MASLQSSANSPATTVNPPATAVNPPAIAATSPKVKRSAKARDLPKATSSESKKGHLTREDYERMVSWLEYPPNYAKCFGTPGRTGVGEAVGNAKKGFEELAEVLNKGSKGRLALTAKSMKERFTTFKSRYVKTKETSKRTGFGVKEEDVKKGIFTLERKLEIMCCCFSRMDALFGSKANVSPLVEYDQSTDEAYGGQLPVDRKNINVENGLEGVSSIRDGWDEVDELDSEDRNELELDKGTKEQTRDSPVDVENLDLETPPSTSTTPALSTPDLESPVSTPPSTTPSIGENPLEFDTVSIGSSSSKRSSEPDVFSEPAKRVRSKDARKTPPKLDAGPSTGASRNAFAAAYREATVQKTESK